MTKQRLQQNIDRQNTIITLHNDGLSYEKIGKQLNLTKQRVAQIMTTDYSKYLVSNAASPEEMLSILREVKKTIDWLERHNKNYTNEQYYKICDIKELVKNFKPEYEE